MTPLIAPDAPTIGIARVRIGDHLRERRGEAAEQIEQRGSAAASSSLRCCSRTATGTTCCRCRCIHEPCRNIDVRTLSACGPGSVTHTSPSPIGKPDARRQRAGQLAGNQAEVADRSASGLFRPAALDEQPGHRRTRDEPQRDERRPLRRVFVVIGNHRLNRLRTCIREFVKGCRCIDKGQLAIGNRKTIGNRGNRQSGRHRAIKRRLSDVGVSDRRYPIHRLSIVYRLPIAICRLWMTADTDVYLTIMIFLELVSHLKGCVPAGKLFCCRM